MTTKSAQDFARELSVIVAASAHAFTTLNRVLEQQQQSILVLASEGGVPAPSTAGMTSASRQAAPQAAASTTSTGTTPAAEASLGSTLPTTASPEGILAQVEKAVQDMIDHAPEVSIAQVYQAAAHAVGLALMNTASAQQQLNIVAQAVVTKAAANQLSGTRAPTAPRAEKAAATESPNTPRAQVSKARAR